MNFGSSPQAPNPPDPYAVSAAQTGADISTATANQWLGNANQITPQGTVTYTQIGTHPVTDAQGNTYQVPQFQRQVDVTPNQRALLVGQEALQTGLQNAGLTQLNRASGVLNSPFSPSGTVNTTAPTTPTLTGPATAGTQATSFAPGQGVQGSVSQTAAPTTFASTQGPQMSVGPNDFSTDRQNVVDALNSRLEPQITRDRATLDTQLANQGITQGSEAYNNAVDAFGRQVNDQRMQSVLAGGQEQSRLFGLDLSQGQFANSASDEAYQQEQGRGLFGQNATAQNNQSALAAGQFGNMSAAQQYSQNQGQAQFGNQALQQNYANSQAAIDAANQNSLQRFASQLQGAQFGNQAQQQWLQQQLAVRNQPLNEISALMSGSQVSVPQFASYNAPQMPQNQIGSNIYNSAALAQQNYQSELAAQNASMGGLFGLGSAGIMGAFMKSDRRVKRDVTQIGDYHGLPVYTFNYLWDWPQAMVRVGFMADEVEQIMPEAVVAIDGIKAVHYGMVIGAGNGLRRRVPPAHGANADAGGSTASHVRRRRRRSRRGVSLRVSGGERPRHANDGHDARQAG